ncbi:hypothetical protein SUGI_0095280 [Cryptomeria japonica]|nr:hypothetical protein SUGI_0095280 [Cryptomeria japonica]
MAKSVSDTEMGVRDSAGSVSNHAGNGSHFYIEEPSSVMQDQLQEDHPKSAHRLGHDPWYQLGLLLAASFNCGYILGFSNFIMKPLGWTWGPLLMAVVAVISIYANWLLSKLHIIDGKRFIRYRDLMGFVFGRQMYYVTWILQFLLFILGNMGFLILSGGALKQIYMEASNSSKMTLQEFIIISGVVYFVFSFLVPHLSAMRMWIGISAFLTFIYIVILMKISISDGMSNSKNYNLLGSRADKVFNGFNAIASIIFASNSGMVPELQASLRKPSIKNMHKALYFQFTVGLAVYYTVTIVGYWAYGSSVSTYILNELSGPKWAKILANTTVYLQIIVSQHMFCTPVHETLDTKFYRINENEYSSYNM